MPLLLREVPGAVVNPPPPVVGHCMAGRRPQPFIADPATRLSRYGAVVLARDRIDHAVWGDTRIYESQASPGWAGSDFAEPAPSFDDLPRIFLAAIRTHRVCLLHAHHGMFALEFMALRAEVDLPLVVSFYGFDASGFPRSSPANAKRLRDLFAAASLVLAMSNDMRCDILALGCPPEKVIFHTPTVDTNRFSYSAPRPHDAIEILSLSDFSPKKGIATLLRAFMLVSKETPGTQLRLVGSPTAGARAAYEDARRSVQELGLADMVSFEGWRHYATTAELYRRADIFALPSEMAVDGSKEGVPAVLLEAMACGRPVVSTHHAGIPEAVADGETGLLVPERDVRALAAALLRLITCAELRVDMGRAARSRVEKLFNCDVQGLRLADYYDSVLGYGRSAASANGGIPV